MALRWSQDALTLARELADAQSIAFALHGRCTVLQNRREGRAVGELAEALIEISSERFPYWTIYGRLYRDWALVEVGGGLEPIARMHQDLATIEAMGTLIALPYHLTRLMDRAAGDRVNPRAVRGRFR
jgi:hypothetical protein